MMEALEMLSSLTSEGSNWPYILIQLYEGANHMPLPEDRHICILPQEKAESPSGQISQLKICWLLSTGPSVVFPIELNRGDQSVTIDLPKSLHTSSSVTTDEYPYIKVNIPTSIQEEQDHASLPLGGKHDTPTITQPKTPWKPRITLAAEVNNLIDWVMMDNYDQESEHSLMVEEPTTEADASQPLKMEMSVLPLDTSFQASAAETEASMESNPISTSLIAVAHSSHSSSPIADLSELQSDVHLAVNSMFTARRSSDLEIQHAIQDFEASLHQSEAEAAAANEKAKVAHLRRDLRAKVKCAKAVMKAKYEYCMAVQKARVERCTELEESEATYSEALSRNVADLSLQCATLCREHMENMWELETHTLKVENKSWQDFLLVHQAVLHQATQSLKEDLHASYSLLLGPLSSSCQSITLTPMPKVGGWPLSTISLKPEPKWSPPPERQHSSMEGQGDTSMDEDFPIPSQRESLNPKEGKTANWLTSMKSSCVDTFSRDSDPVKEARACYFTTHSWDWAHSNSEDLSNIFRELTQEAGLLGESIFEIQWSWEGLEHLKQANYNFHSQPKGLRFLRAVSAKESPKEMGLKGIHDPEALWHFVGYTYCPWCGKYRRNEGTIVNHLRMVHYKLGLICNWCFGCPTTTLDTLTLPISYLNKSS